MLMWAHYASEHSGFCLGFERSEGSLLNDTGHTKPVDYLDAYPEIDLSTLEIDWTISVDREAMKDSSEIDIQEPHLQKVIYSKSKDWSYEQGWRTLVPEGDKLSSYPGPLRRIIFGLWCEPESRLLIEKAALAAAEKSSSRSMLGLGLASSA